MADANGVVVMSNPAMTKDHRRALRSQGESLATVTLTRDEIAAENARLRAELEALRGK